MALEKLQSKQKKGFLLVINVGQAQY
jgi:hypothetical protein